MDLNFTEEDLKQAISNIKKEDINSHKTTLKNQIYEFIGYQAYKEYIKDEFEFKGKTLLLLDFYARLSYSTFPPINKHIGMCLVNKNSNKLEYFIMDSFDIQKAFINKEKGLFTVYGRETLINMWLEDGIFNKIK